MCAKEKRAPELRMRRCFVPKAISPGSLEKRSKTRRNKVRLGRMHEELFPNQLERARELKKRGSETRTQITRGNIL